MAGQRRGRRKGGEERDEGGNGDGGGDGDGGGVAEENPPQQKTSTYKFTQLIRFVPPTLPSLPIGNARRGGWAAWVCDMVGIYMDEYEYEYEYGLNGFADGCQWGV